MANFIDRRINNRNKSAVNRERFMQRFKKQIRQAVSDAISGRSISNIEQGENVIIPNKDIQEPLFKHGEGGKRDMVLPGNKKFVPHDKIKRPTQSSGQDPTASDTGEGEDPFIFQLSKEEFLDLFFENLALPDLVKTNITKIPSYKKVRAGYTSSGIPANINIKHSLKNAIGRRLAARRFYKNKLATLEQELEALMGSSPNDSSSIKKKQDEIDRLQKRKPSIPFIDPVDIKYNHHTKQPEPNTQAVMFCLMDVSGSMDEAKKDIAKRFFILLYLFLNKNYEKIEIVFIRHHTSAKEVSEHDFFYSRETGGTVVSSALELMKKIIAERYTTHVWNIYGAQASDGDNWNNDSPKCHDVLLKDIMPHVQYFAYVEIIPRHHQSLWEVYEKVDTLCPNFCMRSITEQKDIYPVFQSLFKRKSSTSKEHHESSS